MTNRLAEEASPYLRSHAQQPVDWWPWGEEAFAEAARRDVPVLVSIGYATCHWCHVMARESFSDPQLAALMNERLVAIKVDREERPEVDAAHLAAAGAFTRELGWPLNVFVTPQGRPFYALTYAPPRPVPGHPSFRQVLDAVQSAWTERREEVERSAAGLTELLARSETWGGTGASGDLAGGSGADSAFPAELARRVSAGLDAAVTAIEQAEDRVNGGLGTGAKFPMAPLLVFLGEREGAGLELAVRTLETIVASGLRDPVEGGFFRYTTRPDWTEPHYERMLYDNAGLLEAIATLAERGRTSAALQEAAEGIVRFLREVLWLPGAGLASAQDSESVIEGQRSEGGYYRLDAQARAALEPPALDRKVLAGWNGLAIAALARAGRALQRPDWIAFAVEIGETVLGTHLASGAPASLRRSVLDGQASPAPATLEDFGLLGLGLLRAGLASGSAPLAGQGEALLAACFDEAGALAPAAGGDPVLAASGLGAVRAEDDGTLPSGRAAVARAALLLHATTGQAGWRERAAAALAPVAERALAQPVAFGATLAALAALLAPLRQLVVVRPEGQAAGTSGFEQALAAFSGAAASVSEEQAAELAAAGFELFAGRGALEGRATAYLCEDFVCRLPVTDPQELPGG